MGCAKLSVTRVIQIAPAHHVLMLRLILPSDCLHILHIVHSPLGMLQGGRSCRCRGGGAWPYLRGDIALALLCLAMLFAFWGVWALTRQTHESGARIGRATPAQRVGNSAMHGSATGVITFSRNRLIADMLVAVGWLA